jgi:hypothetical protein
MKPRYIRLIVPSNSNSQLNVSSQGATRFISVQPSICQRNSVSSLQIVKKIESTTFATSPPRIILSSTPETINLSNEIAPEEITSSTAPATTVDTVPTTSSSSTNTFITKLNTPNVFSKPNSSESFLLY